MRCGSKPAPSPHPQVWPRKPSKIVTSPGFKAGVVCPTLCTDSLPPKSHSCDRGHGWEPGNPQSLGPGRCVPRSRRTSSVDTPIGWAAVARLQFFPQVNRDAHQGPNLEDSRLAKAATLRFHVGLGKSNRCHRDCIGPRLQEGDCSQDLQFLPLSSKPGWHNDF